MNNRIVNNCVENILVYQSDLNSQSLVFECMMFGSYLEIVDMHVLYLRSHGTYEYNTSTIQDTSMHRIMHSYVQLHSKQ